MPVILATPGREQDCGSKPAWANSSGDPISKISNIKQGWLSVSSGKTPA
jgi:hypothetical protein